MHVDGFRFDLASTLARELYEVNKLGAFFDIIHQDPVLSQVKLIAEPWDVGEGGYQVGNFPVLWTEWNGKYRDCVRRFWKGDGGTVSEFATRLAGSSDLYAAGAAGGRTPASTSSPATTASRCTTWSATTTSTTRPTARTTATAPTTTTAGTAASRGRPTTRPSSALRERQKRNLIATLLLSQGVPMLCGGDELGHTQNGNNNAYCQDNELTWLNWELERGAARVSSSSCSTVIAHLDGAAGLPAAAASSRAAAFAAPTSRTSPGSAPTGKEMTDEAWNAGFVTLPGRAPGRRPDRRRRRARRADRRRHAADAAQRPPRSRSRSRCPATTAEHHWERMLDTAGPAGAVPPMTAAGELYPLQGRSLAVLHIRTAEETGQAVSQAQVDTLRKDSQGITQPG